MRRCETSPLDFGGGLVVGWLDERNVGSRDRNQLTFRDRDEGAAVAVDSKSCMLHGDALYPLIPSCAAMDNFKLSRPGYGDGGRSNHRYAIG